MKKLILASLLGAAFASSAFAQPAPPQPPPPTPPAGATGATGATGTTAAPAAPAGKFAPAMPKGPDTKGLIAAVKSQHDAWMQMNPDKITPDWIFPAAVLTTDGQGNAVYVQVDEATLKAALNTAFTSLPKPPPGQPTAKVTFKPAKNDFMTNNLATVTSEATLSQGKGKEAIHWNWKVVEIWGHDNGGWKIRGYTASGWGDLLKH
jgi:hypothetical protein